MFYDTAGQRMDTIPFAQRCTALHSVARPQRCTALHNVAREGRISQAFRPLRHFNY